jgi:hypothetical protein
MTLQFEALKVAMKQDATGFILTLRLHPDEVPEELLRDFVGSRYMVAAVRINDAEDPKPSNNRTQRAGMLCKNGIFQQWLIDQGLAEEGGEAGATNALYEICGISSRTELNGNKSAQEKFDRLVKEYDKNSPF